MSNTEATKEDMYDEIGAVIADVEDGLKTPEQALAQAARLGQQFGQFADAVDIAAWIYEDLERIGRIG